MAEIGESLSDRELEVLHCLVSGATNKDIAADLTISENTVKVHLRNIYAKLGVSSRTEAATEAIQQGIVTIPGAAEPAELAPVLELSATPDGVPEPEPAIAPAAAKEVAPLPSVPEPETSGKRDWRPVLLLAAALLSLLAIVVIASQLWRPQTAETAVETPFEETPIGSSRWLESRPMLEARANMAVATVGLDLYQIGGETGSGVDGVVRAFNSVDRSWRSIAEKPTAVTDSSAAELYGEIYVTGGKLADGTPTAAVEAYSPTQDAWRLAAPLPHPISSGLTLSDGAFLYVLGGHDGESYLDTVYVYDPASDSWRPLPVLPEARAASSGGTLAGQLMVVGGENDSGALNTCYQFDPAAASWAQCPDLLAPRTRAGSAVLLNRLYVIGGAHQNEPLSFSEMYDPASETWQVINTPMLEDADGWSDPGVGQVETRIYALGGRADGTLLDSTYVFAPLIFRTYIPAASAPEEE